jgi:DNA-binding transcriptional LysR family regulator
MHLDDLRIFCAVAKAGSFTVAASILNMPVATVSRRVNALEASLKTTLLHRTTRAVQLTESGNTLMQRAAPLLEEFENLKLEALSNQQAPRGILRLQIPQDLFASNWIECLQGFMQRYPEISVECYEYLGWNHKPPEEFDLTLLCYELDLPSSNWIARSLLSLTQGIFAHKKFAPKDSIAPESLKQYPLISRSNESVWHFRHAAQIESIAVNSKLTLSSLSQQIQAAQNGMGLIKAPLSAVNDAIRSATLVPIATTLLPVALNVSLYYRSRVQPARVSVFMDYLQRYIAN